MSTLIVYTLAGLPLGCVSGARSPPVMHQVCTPGLHSLAALPNTKLVQVYQRIVDISWL